MISDFVYEKDRLGRTYGWGVAEYATPEKLFGEQFTSAIYQCEPRESYARILAHLRNLLPNVDEKEIDRFLK